MKGTYGDGKLKYHPINLHAIFGALRAAGREYATFGVSKASPSDATPSIQALIAFAWELLMDGTLIALFLFATFLGGFTSGLTGFAAGLVVSGIWLHIITPLQTAVLIAAYGIVNQAYGVWKVRKALQWRRILPFVIGGAVGVPLGAYLVTYINPAHLRFGVGDLVDRIQRL